MQHGIFIDLQAAQSLANAERGIARYSVELARALLRAGAPVEALALNPNLPNPTRFPPDLAASGLLSWSTRRMFEEARNNSARPLAYQIMSPMESQLSAQLTIPRFAAEADALVIVFYDLIPLVFSDHYLPPGRAREPYLARLQLIKEADLLLAISDHTRRDLIEHLGVRPERCVTIGGGVSDWFRPAEEGEDPALHTRAMVPSIDRPFVLTVAGWEWRKNTEALIHAFARLPRDVRDEMQLVVACEVGAAGVAEWRAEAMSAGLRGDQLVVTGFVEDTVLRWLYQSAELFVFPSKYEGFGLPVAEAARCGTAIVTSASSSLPEILDLPESTFPADDIEAMSDVMERALQDTAFRGRLLLAAHHASERHTWDKVANRVVDAYEGLDVAAPRARRKKPLRVAFVGPFSPAESGVATYNSRIVDSFTAADVQLDLFAEMTQIGAWRPKRGTTILPVEFLGHRVNPWDYDVLVYAIGNSSFHVATYDLCRRFPGIVWLHDVSLVGLHLERAKYIEEFDLQNRANLTRPLQTRLEAMRAELLLAYGHRVSTWLMTSELLDYQSFVDRGALMAATAARAATHLIVNSDVALGMVSTDLGPAARLPPCTVLPLAIPAASDLRFDAVVPDPAPPLIVSLGIVDAKKRPAALIAVLATLPHPAQVAFVGPCGEGLRVELERLAAKLNLSERVHFTGFVNQREYGTWLKRAACAVQLRSVNFGESSAAVTDAIAAGVPVITSVAACSEMPVGVVEFVAADVGIVELGRRVDRLLRDASLRESMVSAGAVYGAKHTFESVADDLAGIIRSTARTAAQR